MEYLTIGLWLCAVSTNAQTNLLNSAKDPLGKIG